jgi:hypothetical protein
MLTITPFLIIPIAELLESNTWVKRYSLRAFVYFIFSLGFVVQIVAVSVYFQNYFFHLQFEKNQKFTIAHGAGVQPIIEPPDETYFDWHKSPILAHIGFISSIASRIKDYRYPVLSKGETLSEQMKADSSLNVFDFWWLHKYFVNGSYLGFIEALLLLLIAIYCASRLWQLSH